MADKLTKEARALHQALLADLLVKIEGGTATAAELNVARQFLKDNGVDYLMVREEEPMGKLLGHLPFSGPSPEKTGT